MKYVVDSSVAFKWFVIEVDRPKPINLRDGFQNRTHELFAPDLLPTEIANALIVAERGKRIAPGEAELLLAQALKSLPVIVDAVPLLPRALEIAKRYRRSVYDCLYVALAELEQCDFITADMKLVNALQAAFPFVVSLASMP